MKGNTNISKLAINWRPAKSHDAFRVNVFIERKPRWISDKVHPTLNQINRYLRAEKLRQSAAERDNHFQALKNRLFQELKSAYGLSEYAIREKLDLKSKEFNFQESVEEFVRHKIDTSVSQSYRSVMIVFWLPFFLEKNCHHPKDFRQWRRQAQNHLKTAKKVNKDEKYSIHSHRSMVSAFNEYMKFLLDYDYISPEDHFVLSSRITLEQKKMGDSSQSRTKDTYSLQELLEIKGKIDTTYKDDLVWKLRAYAMYLSMGTGLRRGNLLGLKAEDLCPDGGPVPHLITGDNVVNGWSRGVKGKLRIKEATKAFVGRVKLPFIQPSKEILCEVAQFLKANTPEGQPILDCFPDTVPKWWRKIAGECHFKYLSPHSWKHSYATIGAAHLHEWYQGNPYLLKEACMHKKLETTMKYINQKADTFLEAFKQKN